MKVEQSGAVVWEGRSRLDPSARIAVVVTWFSANFGTGPMAQSWIIRSDVPPIEAVKTGADLAVCPESCSLRPGHPREKGEAQCYAASGRTILALGGMFRGLDRYPRMTPLDASVRLRGQWLRIGAYGDPAAVPISVWADLIRFTRGHTGYTHAPERAPLLRSIVMASAETPERATFLQAQGWRTYRVRAVDHLGQPERLAPGEVVCPKSEEAGKRTACAFCLLCDGAAGRSTRSIAIADHSTSALYRRRSSTGDLASSVVPLRRSRDGGTLMAAGIGLVNSIAMERMDRS